MRRNKNPVMTDYREQEGRDDLTPQKGKGDVDGWTEAGETGREHDG